MKDGFHERQEMPPGPQDAPALLSAAIGLAARLLRQEARLLRHEMRRKAAQAVGGIVMILVAVILALSALDVLFAAAVAVLVSAGLAVWAASLLVGGIALALAAALFFAGRRRLRPESLSPERSVENLRRDMDTIKERANA